MDKLENNYSWIFIKIDVIIEAYGYIYIPSVIFQALQFAWWSSGAFDLVIILAIIAMW